MTDCTDKLVSSFPELNEQEIAKFVPMLEKLKADSGFQMGKYNKEAQELFKQKKLAEILNIQAAYTDSIKTATMKQYMKNAKASGVSPAKALTAKLMSINKTLAGSYDNVQGKMLAVKNQLQSNLIVSLEHLGLDKIALSGKLDNQIADYIYAKSADADVANFPKEIQDIGDLFIKNNINMAYEQQAAGIPIIPKFNYLFAQNHDMGKILDNPKAWVEAMLNNPDIDWDNSFPTIGVTANANGFSIDKARIALEEMVEGFISGSEYIEGGGGKTFGGGKNQLLFKSGSGFLKYNQEWGGATTLLQGMLNTMSKHSEKVALVSTFGNNPISKLKQLSFQAQLMGSPADELGEVNKFIDYIQGKGANYINEDSLGALAFDKVQQAKGLANLVLLGKSGFTSLYDIVTTGLSLTEAYGTNPWVAQAEALSGFISNTFKAPKTRKAMLDYFEISLADMKNEILATYGGEYQVGAISKMNDIYFKLTGTQVVTSISRSSAAALHAKYLTNVLKGVHGNWNSDLSFKGIGYTQVEIDELQRITKLLPKGQSISPSFIRAHSTFTGAKINDLATKTASYITQKMFDAAPAPLIKEKIMMNKHLPKDHPLRVASEVGFQFKATLLKIWGNANRFYDTTSSDPNASKFNTFTTSANAGLAAFTTTAVITMLNDKLMGRDEERDFNWYKRVAQNSGMLGMFADLSLTISEGRVAPPLLRAAGVGAGHVMDEIGYATGLKDLPERRRIRTEGIPMKLDTHKFLDRQLKLIQRAAPNYFLWEGYKNYILEEAKARR